MKSHRKALGAILRLAIAFGIIAYLLSRKEMDLRNFARILRGGLFGGTTRGRLATLIQLDQAVRTPARSFAAGLRWWIVEQVGDR